MNMRYALKSEDTEQITVIQWARLQENTYPELKWLHHCPNGGSRNRNEAVKLKQMGVKSGVSDLCLPIPRGIYCGLYIEMKYGAGRQQPTQKEFLSDMATAGHFVATCYSANSAIEVIKEYIALTPWNTGETMLIMGSQNGKTDIIKNNVMDVPNNSILKDR